MALKPFLYEGNYVCYPMITIVEEDRTIRNNKLQEIVLFDKAEAELGLGQINFRKTSSFCEPGNFVNGININHIQLVDYDCINKEYIPNREGIYTYDEGIKINIKHIKDNGYRSGIHICCAGESKFGRKGDDMYVGVGIRVPKDNKNAMLFMECVGNTESTSDNKIVEDILESIIKIGLNQNIEYEKMFVSFENKIIEKDLGCVLVAIPYFLKE